jgi:hypothetical protein
MKLFTVAINKAERGFLIIKPHEYDINTRYLDLEFQPIFSAQ